MLQTEHDLVLIIFRCDKAFDHPGGCQEESMICCTLHGMFPTFVGLEIYQRRADLLRLGFSRCGFRYVLSALQIIFHSFTGIWQD